MIMNARQHIYVKIMQFAAVLCQWQCVRAEGVGQKGPRRRAKSGRKSAELSQSIKMLTCSSQLSLSFSPKGQLQEQKTETEGAGRSANCILLSNLQTKMCIKIYDERKSASRTKRGPQTATMLFMWATD